MILGSPPLSLFPLLAPLMYTFLFPPRDPTCHGSSREHILLGTWGSLCHEISIATGVGRSGVMAVKAMEHWETPGKDGTECNVDIGSVLNNSWTSKICKTPRQFSLRCHERCLPENHPLDDFPSYKAYRGFPSQPCLITKEGHALSTISVGGWPFAWSFRNRADEILGCSPYSLSTGWNVAMHFCFSGVFGLRWFYQLRPTKWC